MNKTEGKVKLRKEKNIKKEEINNLWIFNYVYQWETRMHFFWPFKAKFSGFIFISRIENATHQK